MKKMKSALDRHALSLALQTCFDELLEALDMSMDDYYVRHSQIRGVCPVHAGADNPAAFTYYFNKGLWFCWTRRCEREKGSDLIGLVASVKGYRINKACRWAQRFLKGRVTRGDIVRARRLAVKARQEPVDWWQAHLGQKDFNESVLKRLEPADEYFEGRGLDPDIAQRLDAGYAPKEWLKKAASRSTDKDAVKALRPMRRRIVFPVRNIDGTIVGFTGRATRRDWEPKWYNWPPKRFKTSINFFNIDRAEKSIRRTHSVIICEGPFDVMKFMMAGYHNCVAVLGLHVTDAHAEILTHCAVRYVILAFDPDRVDSLALDDNMTKLDARAFDVRVLRWQGEEDVGAMKVGKLRRILSDQLGDIPDFGGWRRNAERAWQKGAACVILPRL